MIVVGGVAVLLVERRLVERGQHLDAALARRVVIAAAVDHRVGRRLVVVPLVGACPAGGETRGRGLVAVDDVDRCGGGAGRVVAEVAAEHLAVPGPRVLRVGRGVDADVAAAGLDVVLEGVLLRVVEDVAGRREPDDRVVLREVGVVELRGVLGRVDVEAVGGAEALDRGDALVDRRVSEAGGRGEDEDVLELRGRLVLDRDGAGHRAGVCLAEVRVDARLVECERHRRLVRGERRRERPVGRRRLHVVRQRRFVELPLDRVTGRDRDLSRTPHGRRRSHLRRPPPCRRAPSRS